MNRIGTIYLLALTGLAACSAPALETRESPYDTIAQRNLFQLHPPPTVAVDPPPKPLLRKITLTGITTILGRRLALITIEASKSQPADSEMLAEGQAMNGIEVRSIDDRAGVVTVLNDGEPQLLNFEIAKSTGPASVPIFHPAPPPAPAVRPEAVMTPEEQAAIIELQRIKFQKEGNPAQAILPPTEVTSE